MEENKTARRGQREYRDPKQAVDGFLDQALYEGEMRRQKELLRQNEMQEAALGRAKREKQTKKQKDYQAVKAALLRIIVSGILFLLIYLLAEFEPAFIPFTIQDVKEAIRMNLF